jgi:hypothetical protein
MPLTTEQLEATDRIINGWTENEMTEDAIYHRGLQDMAADILKAAKDVNALTRIHEDIADVNATLVLTNAKARAAAAAAELGVLLA